MDYILSYQKQQLRKGEMVVTSPEGERISLFNLGIKIATEPSIPYWTRKVELFTFKSRSGYFPVDYGTREPSDMELTLSMIAIDDEQREKQRVFLQRLQDGRLWTFEFYNDPYGMYEGVVTNTTSQGARNIGKSQNGTLTLNLQPYRLIRSNYPNEITLNRLDRILFETGELHPVFTVAVSGNFELITENNVRLVNVPSDYPIVIDSLDKKTYQQATSTVRLPRGDVKSDYNYPEIKSGTVINWVGNPTSVKLKLNWRL